MRGFNRALRITLDIGHWSQDERRAVTVSLVVREDTKGVHRNEQTAWTGMGVSITAPSDVFNIWRASEGERLALKRALVDSQAPPDVAKAVWEMWDKEGMQSYVSREKHLGSEYRRISRRVILRSTPWNHAHEIAIAAFFQRLFGSMPLDEQPCL